MTEKEMSQDRGVGAWVHDRSPFGLFTTDTRLEITTWNHWLEKCSGWNSSEVIGKNLLDLYPEIVDRKMDRYFNEALEGQNAALSQVFHGYLLPIRTDADADPPVNMPQSAIISPLILGGQICGTIGYVEDVSDRIRREKELIAQVDEEKRLVKNLKSSEEALREEKEFSESLVHTAQVIILVLDTEGRIVRFNPYMEDLCGYRLEEVQGRDWFSTFLRDQDYDRVRTVFRKAVSNIQTRGNINPIIAKDGREIVIEWYDKTLKDADGNTIGLLAVGQDITTRLQAEEALRESEEKYRDLVDLLPQTVFELDERGFFTFANRVGLESMGYTQADLDKGLNALETVIPEDRARVKENMERRLRGEGLGPHEYTALRKDGSTFPFIIYSTPVIRDNKPVGLRGVSIDITERKRLEARLFEAEKMEAISTLAGGVAHLFNNALSSITGYTDLLQMEFPDDEKIMTYIKSMKRSALDMAGWTSQLVAYSKGGKYQPETVSLSDLIEETLELIKPTLSPDIRVETDLSRDLLNIEADRSQTQMVLSALISNSNEAIEGEERIRVIVRDEEISEGHPELAPGSYLCLSVEDDGKGMDEETRAKMFDPFFTTNFMGRGLGMAAVSGVVKNQGGGIYVDSEQGKGTIVRIYLPRIEVI